MAKTLATLVKLHRFEVEEQQRALAQLNDLLDKIIGEREQLDIEMAIERAAAASSQESSIETLQALPVYIKAALDRARRMERTRRDIERLIEMARDELQRRFETLKSFELAQQAERERADRELAKREQDDLDEVASQRADRE